MIHIADLEKHLEKGTKIANSIIGIGITGNLNLVWLAFPIAEIASATGSTILYQKIKKQIQAV